MKTTPDPTSELLRAAESLARAAADAAQLLRERREATRATKATAGAAAPETEADLGDWLDALESWIALVPLRGRATLVAALEREMLRWAARARDDAAADQVRELFATLVDLLAGDGHSEDDGEFKRARGRPDAWP